MRFETLLRTLLLGVVLSVSPAWAAELAAPAERVGGGEDTLQSLPAKDVSNSQQRRLKKARIKGGKRAGDTEAVKKDGAAANKNSGKAAAAIPENIPPAEPQSIALRGVRG